MSLFSINISKLISDLLPPEKRAVNIIAFCKGLFSKQDNDNLNTLETIEGTTAPLYVSGTYNLFDRVIYQRAVYESLKNSNTSLPTVETDWIRVVDNFLGTNETQKYTTSAIHIEYALNRYFENIASTPYELADGPIYFSNAQLPALSFLVGYTEPNSSAVGYLNSNDYITYDESIVPNYTVLQINVPTATATALGTNYYQIISNFVDKYISLSLVNSTRSMPVKSGTLLHIQDSYKDLFKEVMKCIIASDYDPNKAYILSGCVNTGTLGSYVISAGYIFYANEIFRVPATSFTPAVGETAIAQSSSTNVNGTNYDPVQFTDGNNYNVHYENIIEIVSGVAGSGVSDFANLLRINEHDHKTLTLNTGYKIGSGYGVHATRNSIQQIVIEGNLQVDGGSVAMSTKIATLGNDMKPLHELTIPCCVIDGTTAGLFPAYMVIKTNGDINVYATGMSSFPNWKNNTAIFFNATYYIH